MMTTKKVLFLCCAGFLLLTMVAAVSSTSDTLDLSLGNITQIGWINSGGDTVRTGGNIDLQDNKLLNVGGHDCGSNEVLDGDGNCISSLGNKLSDVLNNGNSAGSKDMDMNGNDVTNAQMGQGHLIYFDYKSDGDQTIDNNGEYVTDFQITYSKSYNHDLFIWGTLTNLGDSNYHSHCFVYFDGGRVMDMDRHDISNRQTTQFFWYIQSPSTGTDHTINVVCRPQAGNFYIESGRENTFMMARVIPH